MNELLADALDWPLPVHHRILVALVTSLDFEKLKSPEVQSELDADLTSDLGARDRWPEPGDGFADHMFHQIKASLYAASELERADGVLKHLLTFKDDISSDQFSAAQHLHWSQMYACAELHRKMGNLLRRLPGLSDEISADISLKMASFKRASHRLLKDRHLATHERAHHDAEVKQLKLLQHLELSAWVTALREGKPRDAELQKLFRARCEEVEISFLERLSKQRSELLDLCESSLESLEPVLMAFFKVLATWRDAQWEMFASRTGV